MNFKIAENALSLQKNSNKERNNFKSEISPEKEAIIKKLKFFCEQNGNSLDLIDSGLSEDSELFKNIIIREEVFKDLNESEKEETEEYVSDAIGGFVSFLESITFTDKFHEDLDSRNKWEEKFIVLSPEKLNQEEYFIITSNRLKINSCSKVFGYLQDLPSYIKNSKLKGELEFLFEKAPEVLKKKDENGYPLYHSLSDDEKINTALELVELAKKALALLTEKKE